MKEVFTCGSDARAFNTGALKNDALQKNKIRIIVHSKMTLSCYKSTNTDG
jgi:hypothetical protein